MSRSFNPADINGFDAELLPAIGRKRDSSWYPLYCPLQLICTLSIPKRRYSSNPDYNVDDVNYNEITDTATAFARARGRVGAPRAISKARMPSIRIIRFSVSHSRRSLPLIGSTPLIAQFANSIINCSARALTDA